MKEHEPKRYFSNIMKAPTNEQHYSETPRAKFQFKVEEKLISLVTKLTRWRKR